MFNEKKIVGLSGGPDSMYLEYILEQKYGKENLVIAHINHKFRKESDDEEKYLKDYFKEKGIKFFSIQYNGNDFRESNLRKFRYSFFKSLGWGEKTLVLGHNLTDRIETTFLNISRGTGLKGFLNMKKFDKKRNIYRPLLDLTKKEIMKRCKELKIPYFIDKTNFNNDISKRNLIRNEILEKIDKEFGECFFYNFNKIYDQVEDILPNFNIEDYLIKFIKKTYKLKLPKNHLAFFIRELLDYFNVYDFRSAVIGEIIDYIKNAKGGGFKQYGKLIITKKYNNIYIGEEKFLKEIGQKIK